MAQSNHKTLIRVLLWWVTLLSICQAALLVLFFTMGHFGKSLNRNAQEGPKPMQSDHLPTPTNTSPQDKAKMFTYKANRVHPNGTITWVNVDPDDPAIHANVNIQNDGDFFVCLRITLLNSTCRSHDRCPKVEVSLKEVSEKSAILTGWIHNNTMSTGLLCKMVKLIIGNKLIVQVPPSETIHINTERSLSSLDLIYMPH